MKAYEENGVGKTLLYEEVSGRIVEMIKMGTYRPGERIPSLRALSRQMRVSVNTVMGAYARLVNVGMIAAWSRSGCYVSSFAPDQETGHTMKVNG